MNTATGIGKSAANLQGVAQGQGGQEYALMMPQIMEVLSPGGDPAVTAATMGALGSRFGAAKQDVMDTAARTGNAAATPAALDSLARSQGEEAAQGAANNVASQHQQAVGTLAKLWGLSEAQVNDMLRNRVSANASYGTQAKGGGAVSLGPLGTFGFSG